jgi:hypothetical protein
VSLALFRSLQPAQLQKPRSLLPYPSHKRLKSSLRVRDARHTAHPEITCDIVVESQSCTAVKIPSSPLSVTTYIALTSLTTEANRSHPTYYGVLFAAGFCCRTRSFWVCFRPLVAAVIVIAKRVLHDGEAVWPKCHVNRLSLPSKV